LNAANAKAFEENQKLQNKVDELKRDLEKRKADDLGEGAEVDLFEALKNEFPDDRISRTPKGTAGADVLHVVMMDGRECGTIVYDSKNHKGFRSEHVAKLRKDQLAARAEFAILSTHKFPEGTAQLAIRDGVILANPARVVMVATLIRQQLQRIQRLQLSRIERESKIAALYEFIISDRCTQLFGRIDQKAAALLEQQVKEQKWHENYWRTEGEAIRAIQKAKADLDNEIASIIGAAAPAVTAPEALEL
jgi:hypothetical protein